MMELDVALAAVEPDASFDSTIHLHTTTTVTLAAGAWPAVSFSHLHRPHRLRSRFQMG